MQFAKKLREGVRSGDVTCSDRTWTRPQVKAGGRYPMEEGHIEVDSTFPITFADITPELARASGFKGVVDLLKTAEHGRGESVYLARFHYVPPGAAEKRARSAPSLRVNGSRADSERQETGESLTVGARDAEPL